MTLEAQANAWAEDPFEVNLTLMKKPQPFDECSACHAQTFPYTA